MGGTGCRPRGVPGGRAGAVLCGVLAALLCACAGAPADETAGARGIGTATEAKSTVRAMTQAGLAALDRLTVEGLLQDVTVAGRAGTATVTGRVLHTQSTTGFSTTDQLDADVTIAFADFRTDLPDGGSATLAGSLDLLVGTGSPGEGAGPDPFPGDQPIEAAGDLAATWHGAGLTGTASDSFSFAAAGATVDGLGGTLTTLAGDTFRF